MKLKTVTGKESFYQWDTDQSLETEGVEENQEVHFCRKHDTVALVCRVRQENGKRIVDVPNELLQTSELIMVYVYARDEWGNRTCHAQSFAVLPRAKPADYVYTQTEVLSYQQLDARLNTLEGEGLFKAVEDYLEENPVKTGATAEEVTQIKQNTENIKELKDNKLDASKLPEVVTNVLAQAKESGEFKGEPGNDYILTDDDKQEIAELIASLVDIPQGCGSAGWETINTLTLEEDSNSVIIDKDSNGNSFELSTFMFYIDRVASGLQTDNSTLYVGNSSSGYFGQMQGQTANQTRIWMYGEFMTNHMWQSAAGNNAGGSMNVSISYVGGCAKSAPMIRLYGYYFGAGTKITLYGVRK